MSLKEMCWNNKLTFFYKSFVNRLQPDYLQSHIEASFQDNYPLRSTSGRKLRAIPSLTKILKKTFLLYSIDL